MRKSVSKIKSQVYLFLVWRVLLFIPLAVGYYLLSYNTNTPYANLWNFTKPYPPVNNFLLYPWANFDGVHYLSIAGNGYAVDGSNARFFPLFPMVIRGLSQIFGGAVPFSTVQFFSGLFLANLFFLLGLIVFYKLIRLDYHHSVARIAILLMLVFPTSFFFAGIYSESLFLLFLLLTFYFVRRRWWLLTIIFGMLLCATRIIGVAILPALVYEFWRANKQDNYRLIKIFSLALIPAGIIGYMFFNLVKWGNAFVFFLAQGQLANNRSINAIIVPFQTLFRYGKILTTVSPSQFAFWIALLEALTFIAVALLFIVAWKKKIRRSYLLFSLIAFLVPAFSGTFSALPRYVVVLFPIFMTVALFKNKIAKVVYAAVSVVILFILLVFFSRGYFIA